MCIPYGLSVRVNAKEALPDELKYKDWDTSGSERINSTWPLECLMAGLPGHDREKNPVGSSCCHPLTPQALSPESSSASSDQVAPSDYLINFRRVARTTANLVFFDY